MMPNPLLPRKPLIRTEQNRYTWFFNELGQWNNHVHLAEGWSHSDCPHCHNTLAKMEPVPAIMRCLPLICRIGAKVRLLWTGYDKHPYVLKNLGNQLQPSYGTIVIPASNGELASGFYGMDGGTRNIRMQFCCIFTITFPDGKRPQLTRGRRRGDWSCKGLLATGAAVKWALHIAVRAGSRGAEVTS